MGVFQKSKRNLKSHINEKLKVLESELKKTDVAVNDSDRDLLCGKKNNSEQLERYNWRNSISDKKESVDKEEEISLIRESKRIKNVKGHINIVEEKSLLNNQIFNIPNIEKKIDRVLKIYDSIQEGLLDNPPETTTPDPLTPLNQNFVTVEELNKHYNLFINRIQQQLSTLGGGGEVRLKYLDDIVGIATNAAAYDGKYLKYNDTLGKFQFDDVISGLTTETQSLNNVLNLGNTSALGINVGPSTFTSIFVSGSTTYQDVNVAGISTFNGNAFFNQNIKLGYGGKINFGLLDDLQIYNDGFNSYIDDFGVGDLYIRSTAAIHIQNALGTEYYAKFNVDSSTELYFDNVIKFQTVINGSITYGNHHADSFTGNGSSLTGITTSQIAGLSTVASTGSYTHLTNKPFIPTNTGDLTNNVGFVTSGIVSGYATTSYVNTAVANLVDSSPAALDTLNELAQALNDDPNFATTITNSLSLKANLAGAAFTGSISAPSFNGNATSATYATSAGIATFAQGLIGSPNINVGSITANDASFTGIVTASDFNSSSDIALKENVEVIENPLDKLLELRGVTFEWKENKKSGVGVVAQDVEKVLPQAVGGSKDHKTVNYNAIIGLLVESVKQQQKEIDDLRKRMS